MKRLMLLLLAALILLALTGCCLLHEWSEADCANPQTCMYCGEQRGSPLPHQWTDATCTRAQECELCGQTAGAPLDHLWIDVPGESYKYCGLCDTTIEYDKTVYINELVIDAGMNGMIWTRSDRPVLYGYEYTNEDAPACWTYKDGLRGHTPGVVRDNYGNVYTYGIHIDGSASQNYYYGFYLGGEYTTFSGTVACPDAGAAISSYVYDSYNSYSKYFEVYGDGRLLFVSPAVRYDYPPQEFSVDISGVQVLIINYPASSGPNEIATIYDGIVR